MKTLIIGAGVLAVLAGGMAAASARAGTAEDEATAPIAAFVGAFDKGDMKAAAAQFEASVTIIDEVAPYVWTGPEGLGGWAHDLMAADAKAGITDEHVDASKPSRVELAGDGAYAVVPAVYSFKDHGSLMSESAQMTFALRKGAAGWKIVAWTWTGPRATPAK